MSRSGPANRPRTPAALDVLCSVETMKPSFAARAAAASPAGSRRPSACTVCRCMSPRYQAGPRPVARAGGVEHDGPTGDPGRGAGPGGADQQSTAIHLRSLPRAMAGWRHPGDGCGF
ncbi:hypothetical protein [Dactylosporangium sp. CA-139066]|uniref:hypothetical protein n=1 Tax=Dactylosporangium sp. CA-139066 TaxID=3239930 RepID=UPI003D945AA4